MSDRRQLAARLQAIGRTEVPPLTEERLAVIEGTVVTRTATTASRAPARRPWGSYAWVGAAAIVVALAVAVAVPYGHHAEVRIVAAAGVVVEVPGSGPRVAVAGDALPDGALVEVAAGGAAVVGHDRFGPGRYLVVGGRLVALTTTTTTSLRATSTNTRDAVAPSSSPPPTRAGTTAAPSSIVDGSAATTTGRGGIDRETIPTIAVPPTTTSSPPSRTSDAVRPTRTDVRAVRTTTTTIATGRRSRASTP